MSELEFLPLTIQNSATLARRVLEFVQMSENALLEFEQELKRGMFRVTYKNRERALQHAKEQGKYLHLAVSRSECGIWIFLGIERTNVSLAQFVESNSKNKILLRKILREQKEKLAKLTVECHLGIE